MGARYPWYLLADSPEGQRKEAGDHAARAVRGAHRHGKIRQGFVYDRVPHITLKSIANNAEIDVIWETWQETLELLRARLNAALGKAVGGMGNPARGRTRVGPPMPRRRTPNGGRRASPARAAIDASIAAKADYEYLYDKPYADNARIRVAGPFTVESLAPHRMLAVDENDELFSAFADKKLGYGEAQNFAEMILENLRTAGVSSRRTGRTVSNSRRSRPGPATMSAPRGAMWRAAARPAPRAAPVSSLALSSAPSRAPTWSPPRARPPRPASTC